MKQICALSTFFLAYSVLAQLVTLTGETSGSWRWVDVADQEYSAAYQASYSYTTASVQISYNLSGSQLAGTLTATGLKPNFAYQLKLLGMSDHASNELIGYTGRWWREEWDGAVWTNGMNLNSKGDGSFPNPNDVVYDATKNEAMASSPTGLRYKYTAYRVFDYFITDETGAATVNYTVDSCYHVLWKTSQRTRVSDDGPNLSHSFDVEPSSHTQYTTDYGLATETIFGEWERLPDGGVDLLAGDYDCYFILTEESFHGSGIQGNWALAMKGQVQFTIVNPPNISLSGSTTLPTVRLGTSADVTFTIQNTGGEALNLTGTPTVEIIGAHATDFQVTTQPGTPVSISGSASFTVRFKPQALGTRSATIRIISDDPDTPTLDVAITATGAERSSGSGSGCNVRAIGLAQLLPLTLLIVGLLFIRRFVATPGNY